MRSRLRVLSALLVCIGVVVDVCVGGDETDAERASTGRACRA